MPVATERPLSASSNPALEVEKDAEMSLPVMTELIQRYKIEDYVVFEERVLCDLELLLQGAFDPLTGFMTLEEYNSVCHKMELPDGSVFPIPVVLPIPAEALECRNKRLSAISTISSIDEGEEMPDIGDKVHTMTIRDKTNAILAQLEISSIFVPDLKMEQATSLGTTDENHPYVKYLNTTYGDKNIVYVGGQIKPSGGGIRHFDFLQYRKPAKEVRELLAKRSGPIVGFQTRNPMHRAHFELTCDALRRARAEGEGEATLLLTPAMGPTQPGDIDADVRMRCYSAILPYYEKIYGCEGVRAPMMVILPLAMRMAGPREAVWHAIIRKNYGCTHFIVGRDHAGPSAKSVTGEPFYGPYDAHAMMDKYASRIGIEPVLARMLQYVGEENGGYVAPDKVPAGVEPQFISGTEFRRMIRAKEPVPEWFGFPEVVSELMANEKTNKELGLVIYLTGLPSSGKSTLSLAVDAALREKQGERRRTTILDADVIRTHLSKGLGFSKEDRSMNVRRIGYTASEIAKHGGICIVANIAPYKEDREYNRQLIESKGGAYIEIHVDTDVELCETRDVKGLYAKARSGVIKSFTGVSDPYETPVDPEVKVPTNCDLSESLQHILDFLTEKEYI